ncbi:MAG: ATP-binding cassette domain-containing protein, partial [Propionibacteriaceae bacterium]|nr:ATP-binding cassette domain-containing protein [Propionibacteriaceae bacterium]
MNSSSINFSNISFWWPDGSTVLDDVSVCFSAGRTGLIGANGSGKTTVLRLVSGQLAPSLGVVDAPDDIAYLPQNITTQPGATVADLLGVRRQIEALVAIESGDADERHFAVLGDAWDIETQSDLALRDLDIGLCGDDLGRLVSTLSGGEVMLVAVAGCWLHRAGVTLLDEPTNNLDAVLRQRVVDMITAWPGALIVVSHDVPLLDAMT